MLQEHYRKERERLQNAIRYNERQLCRSWRCVWFEKSVVVFKCPSNTGASNSLILDKEKEEKSAFWAIAGSMNDNILCPWVL